jgi:NitT/TauT family transport system substrate-binding protein
MTHPKMSRAAMLALGLAPLVAPAERASAEPLTLRVATDPFDAYCEAYYAQDMGFFKKRGLDVTIITFASGAAIPTAVLGGSADIGISNPVELANGVSRGVPFTIIAAGGMYSTKDPTTLMCVAKNSPIQTAKDLNGKTIGVSTLKDILYLSAKAWLARQSADVSSVSFVELPFSEMGAALERGTIDAAVMVEPALQYALDRGQVRIFSAPYDAIAPHFLIGAWFSTKPYVAANPTAIDRFVAAIYDAARWANKNHPASAEILAKYSKLLPATTLRMRRVVYAEELTPGLIQPELDISLKNGVLDKPITASQMIASSAR